MTPSDTPPPKDQGVAASPPGHSGFSATIADAVRFISPDNTWTSLGHIVSRNRRFGALAMVKWRSFGVGLEWFGMNWLGVFIGPFCVAFGKIEPAQAIEARRAETGTGSAEDESAVGEADAPESQSHG